MFNSRVLRRRWVLAVIFIFSLAYFVLNIYKQHQAERVLVEEEIPKARISPDSFNWQPKFDRVNATKIKTCRNSVQGKTLIADERGYVCSREDVVIGGCCNPDGATTKHYVCDSCLQNGCCSVYEHCVSCCLQPEKQPLLRKILGKATDTFQYLFASVADHFELCLAKCRTSSQSVQHENSYRDPRAKFCYGESPPDLQPVGA